MKIVTVLSCVVGGATAVNQHLADYSDCFSFGYAADIFRGVGGIYEIYKLWDANDTHLIHNVLTEFRNSVNRIASILAIFENNHSIPLLSQDHHISHTKFIELSDKFFHEIISDEFYWKMSLFGWQTIDEYNKSIDIIPYPSNSIREKIGNLFIKAANLVTNTKIKAEIDKTKPQYGFIKKEISREEFFLIAKQYLAEVFSSFSDKDIFVPLYLLTSQRISAFEEQSVFFDGLKEIYLTRDPRDTFIGWIKRGWIAESDFKVFCSWYKYFSVDYPHDHPKILDIRFEDFVFDHEKVSQKILDFCEISKTSRVLNPRYRLESSRKNIGLWKQYPNQDVMKYIASELKDYLYEA